MKPSTKRQSLSGKPVATSYKTLTPSSAPMFVPDATALRLEHLVAPHVDSFNYFLEFGIKEAISDLPPLDMRIEDGHYVKMQFTNVDIAFPSKRDDLTDGRMTPREARERDMTYSGAIVGNLMVSVGNDENASEMSLAVKLGDLPIMVKSEHCHLRGLNAQQLVLLKEEANEMGGYFICNGIERVIRLLQVQRRNHAMAIERSSYKNRGPAYSDKGERLSYHYNISTYFNQLVYCVKVWR